MKILVLQNSFLRGGAEVFTEQLSRFPEVTALTAPALRIGPKLSKQHPYQLLRLRRIQQILINHIQEHRPDWVIAQFKLEQLALGLMKPQTPSGHRFGRVFFEHGPITGLYRYIPGLKSAYQNAEIRLAGTHGTANQIAAWCQKPVQVVPYFVPLEQQLPKSITRPTGSESKRIFIWADQSAKNRGLKETLMAWNHAQLTHAELWILGEQGGKPTSWQDPQPHKSIRYLGYRRDFLSVLGAGDVFVNSSYAQGEAFPLRLVQALALGLSLISPEGPFSDELLTPLSLPPFEANIMRIPRYSGTDLVKELHRAISLPWGPRRHSPYPDFVARFSPERFREDLLKTLSQ